METNEEDKIFWFAISLIGTLVALMWVLMLIFPNPHPGTLPPGGDVYIVPNLH
jgi:hypothetical protein